MKKKVLFVCTGNQDRSPTAEELLKGKVDFSVRSRGTSAFGPRRISEPDIKWADQIFVMETDHRDEVLRISRSAQGKVTVLDIPDDYCKGDPELVGLLIQRLSKHGINV